MPQSLAQILVHLVFSTKDRQPWLDEAIRPEMHSYIGGIVEGQGGTLLCAGSVKDHIHLLIAHPRTCAPSTLVLEIKTSASKWLKAKDNKYDGFYWQRGYGMFSVSPSQAPAVKKYLASQDEHHKKVTFQDEYRLLLEKCGVAFDERYVWD